MITTKEVLVEQSKVLQRRQAIKTFKNLFPKLITDENILLGLKNAAKHKTNRRSVQWALHHPKEVIEQTRKVFLDDDYHFPIHEAKFISNRVLKKNRLIVRPYFVVEQIAQHAIMNLLKDDWLNSMYIYSCGSLPGRGGVYAKDYIVKKIRQNKGKTLYVLKADVKHFFESLPIDMFLAHFQKYYKDERFVLQVKKVLEANWLRYEDKEFQVGLPIGYYTSQWFANWYLSPLDHYIKHVLKCKTYVRYVDDMVFISESKEELHTILNALKEQLSLIGLELKGNYQIFKFCEPDKTIRHIDFLGYKFYHNKTTIRKCIFKKAITKARRMYNKGRLTYHDCQSLLSYVGWFKHTDCEYAFYKYIGSKINIGACKKIISHHQLKINKQLEIRLQNATKNKEENRG